LRRGRQEFRTGRQEFRAAGRYSGHEGGNSGQTDIFRPGRHALRPGSRQSFRPARHSG